MFTQQREFLRVLGQVIRPSSSRAIRDRDRVVEKEARGKKGKRVGGTCPAYRFESSPSSFLSVPTTGNRGTRQDFRKLSDF